MSKYLPSDLRLARPFHDRSRRREVGFSLVEITIAIGIVAYALVAMLGLFSVGLSSSRDASAETSLSRIAHNITSRYKGSKAPASGGPMTIQYDFDGEAEDAVPSDDFKPHFIAEVTFEDPAIKGVANVSPNLRFVKIDVASPADAPVAKRSNCVIYAAVTLPKP